MSALDGAGVEGYLDSSHVHIYDLKGCAFLESLFDTMLASYGAGTANSEAYLKTALMQLLIFMSENGSRTDAPSLDYASPTHRMICEITAYINNNFCENITLASISEHFFISPCYFSRTFKAMTGLSFTEYLNNVRIKEALECLEKTDMSILNIAQSVGFAGNTHFGRVFKSIVGMSPMAYRKSLGK